MQWNIAPECISIIVLCIIWVYSRKGNVIPSLKNKLFQLCFFTTFVAMITNILSTWMIYHIHDVPLFITYCITLIYFVFTPLMGVAYFYYSSTFPFERKPFPKYYWISCIPAIAYVLLVLSNPFTQALFTVNAAGYFQGPYVAWTYIVFYFYCICCFFLVFIYKEKIDKPIRMILTTFPLIALLVILFQQLFPDIILSGTAATCALLMIYLNIQNKQISLDYLLGIPNHQEFMEAIQLLLHSKTVKHATIAVFSLRGFKRLNDRVGQQNGDAFLKTISSYIQNLMGHRITYRYSGDEFAFIFVNETKENFSWIINEIQERMENNWEVNQLSAVIPFAIGMVEYPTIAENANDIINGLEHSVSRAKQDKSASVCVCTQKMLGELKRKNQVVAILQEAVRNQSLDVYVQPIWSIEEKRFTLGESLLRLMNTPLGAIYPDELIPIAEDTGLIIPMTYQILDKVCEFVYRLESEGIIMESISVNFSALQFTQENLIQKIYSIVDKNKIPPSRIKIEMTESVVAQNELFLSFIEAMHTKGIQIALDDFGTGYCNLVSVMSMPLDVIKLDKSLLWSSQEHPRSAIMMRTICQTVHELGMKIVSEGVENAQQDHFAKECGCDWIQGYYYAKPMPLEEAFQTIKRSYQHSTLKHED